MHAFSFPSAQPRKNASTKLANHSDDDSHPSGVHPSEMVGKVLKSIKVSKLHPTVTIHFEDRSSFQIRVDGYNPVHPGVPKTIETDPELRPLLAADGPGDAGYTVAKAAMINITDRAFKLGKRETTWDQRHAGVAFKFEE